MSPMVPWRRRTQSLLLLTIFLTCFVGNARASGLSPEEELYRQAQSLEEEKRYTGATELYSQALPIFLDESNPYLAAQDSMRCVVQKDTDVPLIPRVGSSVLLSMAIQAPSV